MYIPSYDDLTPPIPNVSPGEVFDVTRVLCTAADVAAWQPGPSYRRDAESGLYVCLRSTRTPEALLPLAKDFSPRIQRYGASSVVLDVSGLGRLLGDPQAIGAELCRAGRERSKQIAVSVAPTQAAALLLAHAALPSLTVVTGGVMAALGTLPLAVLRQVVAEAYGGGANDVHAHAFDVLRLWGLTTIGEFAALPVVELSERLGQGGVALQAIARGIDPAPLVPDPGVPRFVQSIELEWPIEQLEPLAFVLPRLIDPLSLALERADRGAAAIRVDLRLVDRTTHGRVLQLPAAMRDPRVLRTLVLLDLESHPPAAGIDVVTIEVDPAPARIVQYSLLERARPSAETVATLTARLNALVGESRCGSPFLLDTHGPDGFEMRRFEETGTLNFFVRDQETGTLNFFARDRSEKVECPLRRFRPPVAIRVAAVGGRPISIAIDRRGMPGGRVERAAGPWRTSGAWWHGATGHWDRDEWDTALADGTLCRIFLDRASEKWFLEGVID